MDLIKRLEFCEIEFPGFRIFRDVRIAILNLRMEIEELKAQLDRYNER